MSMGVTEGNKSIKTSILCIHYDDDDDDDDDNNNNNSDETLQNLSHNCLCVIHTVPTAR